MFKDNSSMQKMLFCPIMFSACKHCSMHCRARAMFFQFRLLFDWMHGRDMSYTSIRLYCYICCVMIHRVGLRLYKKRESHILSSCGPGAIFLNPIYPNKKFIYSLRSIYLYLWSMHGDSIFTKSVTYCFQSRNFLISRENTL